MSHPFGGLLAVGIAQVTTWLKHKVCAIFQN